MNLAELEQYFARAATSGSGPLPDLESVFLGSQRLSAQDRLAIYNRGYFYRLLDALGSVFAQTKRVLGDDFERLALAYFTLHPSEHHAVERVGRSFSEYLSRAAAPAAVVDLAALEWARLCALVAANPQSVATVDTLDPARFPEARLRFVPSFCLLELDPRALLLFAEPQPMLADLGSARSLGKVAVWRDQHSVRHELLEAREGLALTSATAGAAVKDVCAAFDTGGEAEDVRRAFQVLAAWFARKWLESVAFPGP